MPQDIDSKLVRKLAKLLEETGLSELEYGIDNWKIRVSKSTGFIPQQPISAPNLSQENNLQPNNEGIIKPIDTPDILKSPMVGTAYLTPDPNSPPFVALGSSVQEGETVMIIEAMKVMNPILAHKAGTIRAIFINPQDPLEFGQALMLIE